MEEEKSEKNNMEEGKKDATTDQQKQHQHHPLPSNNDIEAEETSTPKEFINEGKTLVEVNARVHLDNDDDNDNNNESSESRDSNSMNETNENENEATCTRSQDKNVEKEDKEEEKKEHEESMSLSLHNQASKSTDDDTNKKNSNANDESKEKEIDIEMNNNNDNDDSNDIDLTKPLKRPRTAYFVFQQEVRTQVLKDLVADGEGQRVNDVAKRIGKLWANLSNDEKGKYRDMAKVEKEQYEKHKQALEARGEHVDTTSPKSNSNGTSGDGNESSSKQFQLVLPVARIRKICRLDPEVKSMSKESTTLITKAAQCFIEKIAKETLSMAQLQQRSTLYPRDIAEVCSMKEMFFFLNEDMKDLIQEQNNEKKRKKDMKEVEKKRMASDDSNVDTSATGTNEESGLEEDEKKKKQKKNPASVITGIKPMTSYFTSAATK